ncbi:MAG: FKBP-type peptidyl-prolyl cis-trans isomerase, partial [Thermoplasmata archaeon]|nr:FKBP-type peptidyl-prolyl cis-trans isomerase [Thermoplasmata archaeon]
MADDENKQAAAKKKTEDEKSDKPNSNSKKPAKESGSESEPKSAKAEKAVEGDIITLDMDAWVINQDGSEELFETTNEELAKKEDIFEENAKYRPLTTIVGAGRVITGLDKSFEGAEIGKKITVEIPPEEGDGDWDPSLVEVHSLREFSKDEAYPVPGMEITFKKKTGRIITVMSGRVRIDFNLPLAGKTSKFEYTISKKAKTPEEKTLAIIAMDYGDSGDFKVSKSGDMMEITLPEACKYDQNWFVFKYRVVGDLREHVGAKTIRFVEEYVKKEEKKDEPVDEG